MGELEERGGLTMARPLLSLAVSAAAYFFFDADPAVSVLLFFPLNGLFGAIARNDGRGIAGCVAMLLLFPVIPAVSEAAFARLDGASAQVHKFLSSSAVNAFCARFVVSALSLLALNALSRLAAGLIGDFSMPQSMHKNVLRGMDIACTMIVLGLAIVLVRFFDENVARLSAVVKLALSCTAGALAVLSLRRIFSKDYAGLSPASPSVNSASSSAAPSAVRVKRPPNVRLDDVMGMDEAKEQIRLRMIEPVKNPAKAKRYGMKAGGGVLLYGPPGTGKTMLARAVAGELHLPFFMITAADVFGKYVGESERNIRAIFASIRRHPLSVVFIDELETLFPSRSGDIHETTRKVISVILQELDGLDKAKNPILLIGATNVPWLVDEAFLRPGRFDARIFVGLPDEKARRGLAAAALAKGEIPHETNLIGYIASVAKDYSGADINALADRMRQLAYARNLRMYTRQLADEALSAVKPTASGALLDEIRDWERKSSGASLRVSGAGSNAPSAMKSNITLKDVAGMDEVKKQITMRLVEPVRNATLARCYGIRPGGGMLLYGPPGTGKTMLARAVAGELELPFYAVTPADVFGGYVGDAERNIRKIFDTARKNDLSVMFVDELETLFPKRTSDVHETTRKVIAMLLQELDGIDSSKNPLLLIGATNVPWLVDEAFLRPGRFDTRIFVGLPDFEARRAIVEGLVNKGNVRFEDGLSSHIASLTEGYSGADVKGFVETMRQTAFMRRLPYYTKALADELKPSCKSTVSADLVRRIRDWT